MLAKQLEKIHDSEKTSLVKLFVIFICVSLAIFFINISILILPQADKTFNQLNADSDRNTLSAIKNQVNYFIDNHIQTLEDITQNPRVINSSMLGLKNSASLKDFLDQQKVLGKKIPLSLLDITGDRLYSQEKHVLFNEEYEDLWPKVIDDQEPFAIKLVQHPIKPAFILAVGVKYRGNYEGVLIGEIPIDPYAIFGHELLDPGHYITLEHDGEIITTVDQPLSSLKEIDTTSEKYAIKIIYSTDKKPTIERKNSLLFKLILSILTGSLISFLLLLFLSHRLLAAPFRELSETRDAIASSVDGIAIVDEKGNYLSANHAYCYMTGFDQEDIIGENWHKMVYAEDIGLLEDAYQVMCKSGKVTLELRSMNQNGDIFHTQATLVARLSPKEEVTGCHLFIKNIHEKKAAEEKIKEINSHFNAIINNANSIIFIKNLKNQYILVNEYFLNLLDMTNDDIIGRASQDIFDKETAGHDLETDTQVIEHGKTLSYSEHRVVKNEGYYFASVKFPLYRADGSMYAIAGIKTDISEAKKREIEINKNAERFRTLYNNTPVMMHSCNSEDIILSVSDHWLEVMGYQRDEVIGKKSTDFLTEDSQQFAKTTVIPQFFRDGQCKDIHYQMVTQSDKVIDVSLSSVSEYDEDGNFIRSSSVAIDITEKKATERAIEQQRKELELIFNNVPLSIFYKDDKNNILRINETAAATLNGHSQDFEGASTYDLFPDMAQKYYEDDLEVIESGEPKLGIIERYCPKHGEHGWLKTDKVPYTDPVTKNQSILVVAQDITQQRQAEDKLKQAMEALKTSNNELERFAYIASHDLKSPLNSIHRFAKFINNDKDSQLSAESQENLDLLSKRITHMERLLDDLLEYAKSSESKNICSIKTTAHSLVNESCGLLTIPDNFTLTLDESLHNAVIHAMPIRHVFYNLISNAIKHHHRDDGNIRIWVDGLGEHYQFSIEDDGPGIERAYQSKVFDMFEKQHRDANTQGSGMGLAFVQKIVHSVNGEVELFSEKGQGTRFVVHWPKDQTPDNQTATLLTG